MTTIFDSPLLIFPGQGSQYRGMGKDLFDGGGTLADGVEGAWVAVVDKVGGVVVGARATIILMQGSI